LCVYLLEAYMSRHLHLLFLLFALMGEWSGLRAQSLQIECGTWIELTATPLDGFHFVSWSDGDLNAIRQIQVNENEQFIAFFAADCEQYTSMPVVALYDWLLMLDVDSIQRRGFYFTEENVKWYRVVNDVDDIYGANFPLDDQLMKTGYYLTLDRNLHNTGDYYAVVDISSTPAGILCGDLMRSYIIHYSCPSSAQSPIRVTPSASSPGQEIHITGLNPEVKTTIIVYDMAGHQLCQFSSIGESTYLLRAERIPGCYCVHIQSDEESQTIRYIVHAN